MCMEPGPMPAAFPGALSLPALHRFCMSLAAIVYLAPRPGSAGGFILTGLEIGIYKHHPSEI